VTNNKQIYISVEPHEKRLAIVKDKCLEKYYVERPQDAQILGNIYKGRVASVVNGIAAAFVDLGIGKNGFLHLSDLVKPSEGYEDILQEDEGTVLIKEDKKPGGRIGDLIKNGQDLIVQVAKEALGSKGVRITSHIALPGRYLVFMPYEDHLGVSKRISDPSERRRIKEVLKEIRIPKGVGIIVRTAGEHCGKKEFITDIKYLTRLWKNIQAHSGRAKSPAIIHQEYDIILRILRDQLSEEIDAIYVDSPPEFKRIRHFIGMLMPKFKNKLKLYTGSKPLFEDMGIDRDIEKIYNRTVYLKCGGYITIEQTEGLVAVDVNSGKFKGKKGPREMALRVNVEAAQEAARQIHLRNLGGIVIIDFIDMDSKGERDQVFATLVEAMKEDKAKTNILPISEIGIVQLTRQRVTKSLEGISYSACPCCHGKGLVKSASTMAIKALREVYSKLNGRKGVSVSITAHPDVAAKLSGDFADSITRLERQLRSRINVKGDSSLHLEELRIVTG